MNYFDVHIIVNIRMIFHSCAYFSAYFSILLFIHRLTYEKKENKKLLNHDKIYVTPYVEIDIKL